MGNAGSTAADEYPLEPRRLDEIFNSVQLPKQPAPARMPLGPVNANANANIRLPGALSGAFRKAPSAKRDPPKPAQASICLFSPPNGECHLDANAYGSVMCTPSATRSAIKDEEARLKALNVLRSEAIQTAVAEVLAKQAAEAASAGSTSDLKVLKMLQQQVQAVAASAATKLEQTAAELDAVHTRQVERARQKRRVTIADPPHKDEATAASASPRGSKADEPRGSQADETSGSKVDEPRGSKADETSGSKVDEPRGSKADETSGSKADEADVAITAVAAGATPATPAMGLAIGHAIGHAMVALYPAIVAPQPLSRPRSTPEPGSSRAHAAAVETAAMQAAVEAAVVEAAAVQAAAVEAAAAAPEPETTLSLDSPQAVLAYLALRKAQLAQQRREAAQLRAQLRALETAQKGLRAEGAGARGDEGGVYESAMVGTPGSQGSMSWCSEACSEAWSEADEDAPTRGLVPAEIAPTTTRGLVPTEISPTMAPMEPASSDEIANSSFPSWPNPEQVEGEAAAEVATVGMKVRPRSKPLLPTELAGALAGAPLNERAARPSVEEVALVLALRRKVVELQEELDAERQSKERMLNASVVCPHCESIF